jgi:hypothetical protein
MLFSIQLLEAQLDVTLMFTANLVDDMNLQSSGFSFINPLPYPTNHHRVLDVSY